MQPNDEQPHEWQQPNESLPQAPYVVPEASMEIPPQNIGPTQPVDPQPTPVVDVAPQTVSTPVVAGEVSPQGQNDEDEGAVLRWESPEYLHHERGGVWFAVMGLVTIALILLAIFALHSITFAILIPVMVAALLIYVRRLPELIQYTLSRKGLHVNDKLFTYDQFKSFGIISHAGTHSVVLVPRKRFQLGQTLYFPEEAGERIVDMFAERLPMKEVSPDAVDRLLARLRM